MQFIDNHIEVLTRIRLKTPKFTQNYDLSSILFWIAIYEVNINLVQTT